MGRIEGNERENGGKHAYMYDVAMHSSLADKTPIRVVCLFQYKS